MKNGERGEKGELNKNWDTEKRCVTCKVLEKRKKRTRRKKKKEGENQHIPKRERLEFLLVH